MHYSVNLEVNIKTNLLYAVTYELNTIAANKKFINDKKKEKLSREVTKFIFTDTTDGIE